MRWVAPTEKVDANHQLEKRLWDAADQFRANSGLKAGEYSGPVLGQFARTEGQKGGEFRRWLANPDYDPVFDFRHRYGANCSWW